MDFFLKNKIIYIFSPERWGTMKVSKHHYAIQLAKKENKIYFLEPAIKNFKKVIIHKVDVNVNIVQYPFIARGRNKLPKYFYNMLMRTEVKKLQNGIGVKPNIIWCFDPERLDRIPFFKNAIKIFHPVDFFGYNFLPQKQTFDIIFSTIPHLIEKFLDRNYKAFFINHGLSEQFVFYAINRLETLKQKKALDIKTIHAGYVGNLIGGSPDKITMKKVVEQHPDIQFHFWGQYEKSNSTLSFHDFPEVFEFIDFLKDQNNVILHGPVGTDYLASQIQNMDMFWICWELDDNNIWNRFTNPHKIIEYLSTGKPVVTHHIDMYKEADLLYSLMDNTNEKYVSLFNEVISNIRNGEETTKEISRINYALSNTYEKNTDKIEKILQNNLN